ncbi:hypothetical protein [uncultured Winogradskyella sp.]|uniref:hypothetical protein n=1 Tax=Winogradskyella sp. 4-2091 TaxID=3381659 RepID=UPI00261DBEE4|nr:hypothetical protein [uncultured Winogradskyella sp.]
MKTLYQLNKIVLIITLVLYLTFLLGLYAQVVLGAIQLLSAISVTCFWKQLKNHNKKQLLTYWLLVTIYGIGWLIEIDLNDLWWLGIIIIPMSIAIYFVWLLNNVKNLYHDI